MGNDGGVIAVKRKFMRHGNTKARSEKQDQEALKAQRASTCALSAEPLSEPVVACALGNLYNKQALLERLLAKTLPAQFRHISSLKDVVNCRFSVDGDTKERGGHLGVYCPITMAEFNGKLPFVVLPSCGCVVSERAMKEVQTTECLVCGLSMEGKAPILLLQPEEQYEAKQKELLEQKAAEKAARKDKKHKKKDAGEEPRKHKHKSKKRAAESRPTMDHSAGEPSAKIAKSANDAILKNKEQSQVFASLFSSEKKSDKKSANDLLMTVGGLRYTLS